MFDFKTPLSALARPLREFLDEPLPRGVGWLHTLGSALLATVVIQIVTGILLALYYSPNADTAWESVSYIENHVVFGSIIRGMHHYAASCFVILLFLHMLRTFFYGAYKHPRQWTWVLGAILLQLALAFAFTGYLLPWDMKAYFATRVGIHIGGALPVVGPEIVRLMQGGSEMGTFTLSRFYALHVIVLPMALVLVAAAHVLLVRRHGATPPGLKEGEAVTYTQRFYPRQLLRDSAVAVVILLILVGLSALRGAPLEAKADPTDTSYIPRPDWYFYGLFQLLKIFEGKYELIGSIVLPGLFFGLIFLLPFIDTNPERRLSKRPLAAAAGTLSAAVIILLTAWGFFEGEAGSATADETPVLASEEPAADADMGGALFEGLLCTDCHEMISEGDNIPPGLEFSGNKYRAEWLAGYLEAPFRVRWAGRGERPVARMPDFKLTSSESADLAAYLMTLKRDALFPEPEFDWAEADSDMVASGKELYGEYGCDSCHRIGEQGDQLAPDLSKAGSKLQENFMLQLILRPKRIVPETLMKDFQLEQEDAEDIVAYLRTLK